MKNSDNKGEAPITEEMLASLRERIKPYLTDKRYLHTLAVEKEVRALGSIYLSDSIEKLSAAALLHDITKRLSAREQLDLCREFGIPADPDDAKYSAKLFHAKTAAAAAQRDFPEFALPEVISGIRWHTTGRAGMSTFEALVYLADYIEETRTFEDCVRLREYFYSGLSDCRSDGNREALLCKTMILSFDMTVKNLIDEAALVDRDTVEARNYYLIKSKNASVRKV